VFSERVRVKKKKILKNDTYVRIYIRKRNVKINCEVQNDVFGSKEAKSSNVFRNSFLEIFDVAVFMIIYDTRV